MAKMNAMARHKEESYQPPSVEVIRINVECGLAMSGDADGYEDGGSW